MLGRRGPAAKAAAREASSRPPASVPPVARGLSRPVRPVPWRAWGRPVPAGVEAIAGPLRSRCVAEAASGTISSSQMRNPRESLDPVAWRLSIRRSPLHALVRAAWLLLAFKMAFCTPSFHRPADPESHLSLAQIFSMRLRIIVP